MNDVINDRWALIYGDCRARRRDRDEHSVDSIVTDPPYGLSAIPSAAETADMLRAWIDPANGHYDPGRKGFMNKTWDSFVPGPIFWREAIRVIKPGGYLLAFAGSRTVDLMGLAIRLAGFEIRDTIEYCYGSGFPKGLNIARAVDRELGFDPTVVGVEHRMQEGALASIAAQEAAGYFRHEVDHKITKATSRQAATWEGWNTAIKPAHEPIIVARKPFSETNTARNVIRWGTGAYNVQACEVGTSKSVPHSGHSAGKGMFAFGAEPDGNRGRDPATGRWPPNMILAHDHRCKHVSTETKTSARVNLSAARIDVDRKLDPVEEIEIWDCFAGDKTDPPCPILILDRQSGEFKDGKVLLEKGTASRFFPRVTWDLDLDDVTAKIAVAPTFFYTAKAAESEKSDGLDDLEDRAADNIRQGGDFGKISVTKNSHATVKPVSLMRWLCRLVTRKDGLVLDPFCGCGTRGVAAVSEDRQHVGIELGDEYFEIARRRIDAVSKRGVQRDLGL